MVGYDRAFDEDPRSNPAVLFHPHVYHPGRVSGKPQNIWIFFGGLEGWDDHHDWCNRINDPNSLACVTR